MLYSYVPHHSRLIDVGLLILVFRIFAQQCKNIEELVLDGCKRISDRYDTLSCLINVIQGTL